MKSFHNELQSNTIPYSSPRTLLQGHLPPQGAPIRVAGQQPLMRCSAHTLGLIRCTAEPEQPHLGTGSTSSSHQNQAACIQHACLVDTQRTQRKGPSARYVWGCAAHILTSHQKPQCVVTDAAQHQGQKGSCPANTRMSQHSRCKGTSARPNHQPSDRQDLCARTRCRHHAPATVVIMHGHVRACVSTPGHCANHRQHGIQAVSGQRAEQDNP
jgi:hypothetical protein